MKIALLHGADLDHFLPGIERVFQGAGHETRRFAPRDKGEVKDALAWGDVVWCEFANQVAMAASYVGHPNIVVRLHRYEADGLVSKIRWEAVRTLVATSDHVLARAHETCPVMAGVETAVIPSGVDTERFALQPHGPGRRIGVVAYVQGRKQPGLWLQILDDLRVLDPDWELHVAGEIVEPEWGRYLRSMPGVHLHGPVADVAAWWADKDHCLSASIDEGCPYNILEAMACGVRPVIHRYPGAAAQFPADLLWSTVREAAGKLKTVFPLDWSPTSPPDADLLYDPMRYRRIVEERYSLAAQTPALLAVVEKPPRAVPGRPSEIVVQRGGERQDAPGESLPPVLRAHRSASTRPLCSLAMIALVRDEQDIPHSVTVPMLEKAVASVADVCDEFVIVLDDRSRPLVPWMKGMRIVRRKWTDSFAEAREYAAKVAAGDWLLVLDADDWFEVTGNLRESMEVAPPECDVLIAQVKNVDEEGNVRDEAREVVAYRRKEALSWRNRGHNQLSGYEKWAMTDALLVSLYPRSRDREKAEATLALLLKDLEERPGDISTHFHLAKTYVLLGDVENAKKWSRATVDAEPVNVVYASAWHTLVYATLDTEGLDAAEAVVERAYSLHRRHPDILHARAFVQLARAAEAASDPDNPYIATSLRTLRFHPAIARYAAELGFPFEAPPAEEPQREAA